MEMSEHTPNVFFPDGKTRTLSELPQPVGHYRISGYGCSICFHLAPKPCWWHRFWCRVFLGWIWEDEK